MKSRRVMKTFIPVFLISLLAPPLVYSGWLLKDRDGTTTFIQDGKVKQVEDSDSNSFLVMDFRAGQVTLVDGEQKIHAVGTLEEYCGIMQQMMAAFSELDTVLGDEQKGDLPSVKIVSGGSESIAGMQTEKYKVLVDGELYEELWLTTDKSFLKEMGDASRYEKFMECLDYSGEPVEGSDAYRDLSAKGYELRSISYDYGEKEYNSDTVSILEQKLDDSLFSAPSSFRQVKLEELFMMDRE